MVEVKNLTKRYGATLAVDQISFSARSGEVLGFLGPNGAGKTTTMRVITCYLASDDGTATVDGFDISENSIEVRRRIGYLPESAPLYEDMGVFQYLEFIAQVRNVRKSQRKERIREMIDVCGLSKHLQKDVGELSKGYRQRVGLAQALIHNPPVLILDEPTSGLDPSQIIEIRNLIKEIGKEKTVIFSTHILSEVSATCGRVIIISDGKLVANGTPEQLADRAKGNQIVEASIRGPQEEIAEKLESLDFVLDFNKIENINSGEIIKYQISSQQGHETAEEIFHFVVQNRWSLTELREVSVSLEDVFMKLTDNKKVA